MRKLYDHSVQFALVALAAGVYRNNEMRHNGR